MWSYCVFKLAKNISFKTFKTLARAANGLVPLIIIRIKYSNSSCFFIAAIFMKGGRFLNLYFLNANCN